MGVEKIATFIIESVNDEGDLELKNVRWDDEADDFIFSVVVSPDGRFSAEDFHVLSKYLLAFQDIG